MKSEIEMTVEPVARDSERLVSEPKEPACFNRNCIACGPDNGHGLHLAFQMNRKGVNADWSPTADWASFPNTVHGGIVTTVLDEAMSKAVIAMGWQAFTMHLDVRFHHAVRPGDLYSVQAWVAEKQKRRIKAAAKLVSRNGFVHAEACATFLQGNSS